MKILAVQASPHRGNTFRRVEVLGEILKRTEEVEFEHIQLSSFDLQPCLGCFTCFLQGEDKCPLKDDGLVLLEKLDSADAVVFATPVYSMHVSYLMKLFVDRFAFVFHRPRFFGKYAVGMAVTGGVGLKETLEYVKMFSGSWGFKYLDELKYIDPPVGSSLVAFQPEEDRTDFVAEKLVTTISRKRTRTPSIKELLHFHIMRTVYARMEKYLPMDYQYWKSRGWLDKARCYFIPAKWACLKSVFPRLMAFPIGRMIDRKIKEIETGDKDL